MRPESPAYLWDARDAARRIGEFVAGKTLAVYEADPLLRSAVERQFIVVGEALTRLRKVDPQIAEDVPDLSKIIGFRNLLVHGYAEVESDRVWETATRDLGDLIETLNVLLRPYE